MSASRGAEHEELVRELLDELEGDERESIDAPSRLDAEARQRLRRLDVELLGSLALALEPVEPRPGLETELLAAAVGGGGDVEPIERPAREVTAPLHGWMLPLAATLAAAGLGLAGLFFGQLQGQKRVAADLRAQLEAVRGVAARTAAMEEDMAEAKRQLAVVGARGVEVCALRPRVAAEEASAGEAPWGVLYVAPDHQHWYLAVHGLEPSPAGHAYQLWFVADGQPVSAGTFSVVPGGPVELSSETMPAGTSAVVVTLEASGGAAEPQGPEVLFGDAAQAMRVL